MKREKKNKPYINTIPVRGEVKYPGDIGLEWRIRSLIRWNAMAMVVRANRENAGIGGHISTYASAATLFEVAFNHFLRGRGCHENRDLVYFQGHASPGIYARAFLEGRLTRNHLENFRHETTGAGLSSYPHPWLMPHFWEFPTVSMGLSPLMAIYQARFNRYLIDRGILKANTGKVWVFMGDGEVDEPESLGALTLASRENLDNLIFVINCNLQRLDGPVRGNGKIIQELESIFSGAGWNVIKVIWGSDWDPLLAKDKDGLLKERMQEVCDGQYQKYSTSKGDYIREHFFGVDKHLKKMVAHLSDEDLKKLKRGGHDSKKIYQAYLAATKHQGSPTVILAKTIKGYGLGESGEGKNITHQQKKLNENELRDFRTRFAIPITDDEVALAPFFSPPETSPEIIYLKEKRKALGGFIPSRSGEASSLKISDGDLYSEFYEGTKARPVSTTMAFVRILSKLLKQKWGSHIVPIIPDEARTFGMEALFRQCGIYSSRGQIYEPVDKENFLYYRESRDGQILEEGINEAGGLCSFIAAGTSYATHEIPMIPFFIFYSMFGFQRVGDLIWAAADMRTRGFLVGATSGRTTLAGEGLQHQDGQSHVLALSVPNLLCYDPAYAYELAVIIEDGLKRMDQGEDIFYYLTVTNENYAMLPMPEGVREGIIRGIYPLSEKKIPDSSKADILASGALVHLALKAQDILLDLGISSCVFSVTSYKSLYQEACEVDRLERLGSQKQTPYFYTQLSTNSSVVVAVSDYLKALPLSLGKWIDKPYFVLGTDGFGRSGSREELRDFFEVDENAIVLSVLRELFNQKKIDEKKLNQFILQNKIDLKKVNPLKR